MKLSVGLVVAIVFFLAIAFKAAGSSPPRYTVTRVWDGDTIQVTLNGAKHNVRFLGIDAPETHRPNTPVQCWGPEAYRYLKAQLPVGTQVVLHSDPTQPLFDRYNRLLAYVYLVKGKSRIELNYRLVRYGFAHSYHYLGTSVIQAPRLDRAQAIAQKNKLGFWGPPCNGDTKQPEP